ncbi:helix-turn-helix transcriptional regulator [Thermoactinospora rubra]|uniref:helix-turn-helix transcriptional regulator n=1 Tax=Thermoactinospora rubra TaxID=1088767 RepID=UPI000A10063D|nr:helix-turn-helix transcriptional regulator [Thermoactinospora rubra]
MPIRRQKLAQRRKALGFSQEAFAYAVGVERSTVVRWESGETEPRPWHRPQLAAALQLTLEELDQILASPSTEESDDERLAYVLRHPSAVDLVTAAHLAQEIERLNAVYDAAPAASLLAAAGQCHSHITLLHRYAPPGRVRRQLACSVAESATLMGQLVWDASQRRDAVVPLQYFDQAIHAAREIADPVLEAHAQLRKGFVALYGTKDPREGLRLCEETTLVSRSVSNVLTGLGHLHAGEAHAMLGERRACEKALNAAEDSFAAIRPDDEALPMFSPSQFDRLAGSCYLFLGVNGKAEEILTRTARRLVQWKKSQSIVLGNLTLAYIRQGKLEEACGTLHAAIDLIEQTRGGGGMNVAFTAGRELAPWRHEPWVQDISDRLFAMMTT